MRIVHDEVEVWLILERNVPIYSLIWGNFFCWLSVSGMHTYVVHSILDVTMKN